MIYQRWIGTLELHGGKGALAKERIDRWMPDAAPAGAAQLAREEWREQEIMPSVTGWEGRVGPLKLRVGLRLTFTGAVEYWGVGENTKGTK